MTNKLFVFVLTTFKSDELQFGRLKSNAKGIWGTSGTRLDREMYPIPVMNLQNISVPGWTVTKWRLCNFLEFWQRGHHVWASRQDNWMGWIWTVTQRRYGWVRHGDRLGTFWRWWSCVNGNYMQLMALFALVRSFSYFHDRCQFLRRSVSIQDLH